MRRTVLGTVIAILVCAAEARAEESPFDPGAPPMADADFGTFVLREVPPHAESSLDSGPRFRRKKGLDWRAGLYGWLTSVDGSMFGEGGRTDFDIPFSDIMDSTNFGLLGVLRAHKGPWWAEVNVVYGNLGDKGNVIDESLVTVDAGIDIEYWQVDTFVGYDFLRRPSRAFAPYQPCARRCTELAAFAGVRWSRTKLEATIEGNILGFPIGSTIPITETDFFPLGGLWLRVPIGSRFNFEARGWIGGWDALNWQAQAFVSYQFARQWGAFVGWRIEGTDDTTGSGAFRDGLRLDMSGPLIGIGFAW